LISIESDRASMEFRDVLITGGAGFVGSNLAILFREAFPGLRVTVLDNLRRRGSELNLPRLAMAGILFRHGDVRIADDFADLSHFDLLIDCSAESSVLAGLHGSPRSVLETNLAGTINCLEAARVRGAAFVFLSTSRVYSIAALNALPFTESPTRFCWDDISDQPGFSKLGIAEGFTLEGARSFYGTTKLAGEHLIQEYMLGYGMRALINRCGLIAGPWQMGKVDQGIVTLWVSHHCFGHPLRYTGFGGRGKQVRDILHVNDLFDLLQIQLRSPDRWRGEVYNIGGGPDCAVSLRELTTLCVEETGVTLPVTEVAESAVVDVRLYVSDTRKAESEFGWRPSRSPAQVVREIRLWIEGNRESLRGILP
jgi:CDP-paratose 2-epimerase